MVGLIFKFFIFAFLYIVMMDMYAVVRRKQIYLAMRECLIIIAAFLIL